MAIATKPGTRHDATPKLRFATEVAPAASYFKERQAPQSAQQPLICALPAAAFPPQW
ncbi:hypothetical protein INH39_02725 [Massilia violaceinigra]|uniref:Uncharacterized protein n=1 Tax=Massilia violaceinigra TaxID=2045208 RepID=A0ABY4A7D2_9BURK|nr:hypothetical protein [Massilia violaceinigra]UOD30679.1 hypothetical protein INH39_02725 [Massilia violaceinigra]